MQFKPGETPMQELMAIENRSNTEESMLNVLGCLDVDEWEIEAYPAAERIRCRLKGYEHKTEDGTVFPEVNFIFDGPMDAFTTEISWPDCPKEKRMVMMRYFNSLNHYFPFFNFSLNMLCGNINCRCVVPLLGKPFSAAQADFYAGAAAEIIRECLSAILPLCRGEEPDIMKCHALYRWTKGDMAMEALEE